MNGQCFLVKKRIILPLSFTSSIVSTAYFPSLQLEHSICWVHVLISILFHVNFLTYLTSKYQLQISSFAPLCHYLQMIFLYYIPTHLEFLFLFIFLVTVIFRVCHGWNESCPSTAVPVGLSLVGQVWSPKYIIVSVEFLVLNKSIWGNVYHEFIKRRKGIALSFQVMSLLQISDWLFYYFPSFMYRILLFCKITGWQMHQHLSSSGDDVKPIGRLEVLTSFIAPQRLLFPGTPWSEVVVHVRDPATGN